VTEVAQGLGGPEPGQRTTDDHNPVWHRPDVTGPSGGGPLDAIRWAQAAAGWPQYSRGARGARGWRSDLRPPFTDAVSMPPPVWSPSASVRVVRHDLWGRGCRFSVRPASNRVREVQNEARNRRRRPETRAAGGSGQRLGPSPFTDAVSMPPPVWSPSASVRLVRHDLRGRGCRFSGRTASNRVRGGGYAAGPRFSHTVRQPCGGLGASPSRVTGGPACNRVTMRP
jgi:hypothetical protein